MAINLDLVGKSYGPSDFTYTHRDMILFSLGIGPDDTDLEFLYEKHGPKVYPSFAAVGTGTGGGDVIGDLEINPMMIIHGEQRVKIHKPIPPEATVSTTTTVAGIYDKGSGALVNLELKSTVEGELVFENVVSMFVRGEGGFGGERGPKTEKAEAPDRAPDKQIKVQTERRQALLYRLSGDWNPLHADPDIAKMVGFERPILHGLCTFGCTTRAIVKEVCGNDPEKIRSMAVRFSSPVLPGDGLVVSVWQEGKTLFVETKNEAGEVVLTNGVFELA